MYHGQRDPTSPVEKRETYLMEVTRLTYRGFKRCCVIYKSFLPVSPKAKAGLGVQSLRPSVHPSVPKSCPRNSSETTDPIFMKLEHQQQISIDSSTAPVNFVPMKTPILDKDVSSEYSSSNNIQTVIPSLSDIEDEPLQFVKNQSVSVSNNSLNLPYSDSDDENEDDTCNDCRAACIEAPRRDKMQWDQGGGSTPVPP
ncbi:uncharacterized protein LOC111121655 isoform X3 [Crassostrea virginica]